LRLPARDPATEFQAFEHSAWGGGLRTPMPAVLAAATEPEK